MYILSSIKTRGPARPYAIGSESLYGFLLEGFIREEVVVIVGSEIGDGAAIGKLALGSGRSSRR